MRWRKWLKILLLILTGLLGMLLLAFVFLNLPFTQRYATRQVNQIFNSTHLPIRLDAIRKIMPGSVNIQGILIGDPERDTILFVGELQADIRLIPLLKSHVILKEVGLDGALVELDRNSNSQDLNIAAVFQSAKKNADLSDKPPAEWDISIRKGAFSNIHFLMQDSLSGIHIAQHASEIEIGAFRLSLSAQKISCRSLFLREAEGQVLLTPRLIQSVEPQGSPWDMDFNNLALENVGFIFEQGADSLRVETRIGKGNIEANEFELLTKTADFKSVSLENSTLVMQTGKTSGKQDNESKNSFLWDLSCGDIDIRKLSLSLGSAPGEHIEEIDLRLEDLRLDKDQAGTRLRKVAFEMGNGFSVQKMSGEITSEKDHTRLQLEIESAYSRLALEGDAEAGFQDILSAPAETGRATLDILKSQVSLKDLSFFMADLDSLDAYTLLAETPFEFSAKLHAIGPRFSLSECSVSQDENFRITLEGDMSNPFVFSNATGDLELEISGFNQAWVERLAAAFDLPDTLPDLTELQVQARISDSLLSPDIMVALSSPWGGVDLGGDLDIRRELFMLDYSFQGIALGDLLHIPDLGLFTGAGEIKGKGFSLDNLNAGFYLQLDTLTYKNYEYGETQVTGTIGPGNFELQVVANDPNLKADVHMLVSLADSAFQLQTSGILQAQLNELHLYADTLWFATGIDASLVSRGKEVESEAGLTGLRLRTPRDSALVREMKATFRTDSIETELHADADFFQADLHLVKPVNELDSLGRSYQHYFSSFLDPSHLTAEDRVSGLPEIQADVLLSHHELLDIFVKDTGFNFSGLDISIVKESDQNSLRTFIGGEDVLFKMVEIGKLSTVITDADGIISLELISDSTSLYSGPDYRWVLNGEFSNWSVDTRLSVGNYRNQNKYQIEVAGRVDSSRIVLEIPKQLLTLNGEQWQLESPDLLYIDLASNRVFPEVQMKNGSSIVHLSAERLDPFLGYNLELDQVKLSSLLRTDFFTGSPEGTFTGSVHYRTNGETERRINTEMLISDIVFSEEEFNDIQLQGAFSLGAPGAYALDLHARMDSINIQAKGEGAAGGDRVLNGVFSHLPLATLEPFTDKVLSQLEGSVSGEVSISSQAGTEQFGGKLLFQDAGLKVNVLNSAFRIPNQEILVADERVDFKDFTVLDTLGRPLKLDGFLDFSNPRSVRSDLNITSARLQVMSRDTRSKASFTGNVFVDSRVTVKGPLSRPNIAGRIQLSEGTEIYYLHQEDLRMNETERIVNFVDHSPLTGVSETSELVQATYLMNSSVATVVEVDPNTRIYFTLARRMFDIFLDVKGGGNVQYNMENGRMSLSGKYEVGEGTTLLKLLGWPDKSFRLVKDGYIRWDGRMENPELNLDAENKVTTSYVNPIDNRSREIDFYVILRLSGPLDDLNVLFTIRTPDQYVMSVINALSPEEQMRQAISVLLFETIDLPGVSSSTDYMTQQVNQILSSQLNQLTKSAIKGVDISFGINTYDQSSPEQGAGTSSSTSLSYDVSKSLLNNRAQIELSGRFNDENKHAGGSDHSLNNVSFEYQLDSAASKYLKVYNEHTYDDVFEGEVIKTGVGFSYKKRYRTFKEIWKRKK